MSAQTRDGATILIEVSPGEPETVEPAAGLGGTTAGAEAKALDRLREASITIADVCEEVAETVQERLTKIAPDELTLEFGVKLAGKAGVPLVAEGSAEGTFKVTAKWTLGA